MELTLSTPALLFSAISLLMIAFTNRFLALAALVRELRDRYITTKDSYIYEQLQNLRRRIQLIKITQLSGISSLTLCVISMFLIYVNYLLLAEILFGIAMLLLIVSLLMSAWEIAISVSALDLHMSSIEKIKEDY